MNGPDFRAFWLGKALDALPAMLPLTPQWHRPGAGSKGPGTTNEPERINNESGARVLGTFALEPVLQCPLGGAGGDAGADHLLGLGVGDRDRQDVALRAHASRHGPFR